MVCAFWEGAVVFVLLRTFKVLSRAPNWRVGDSKLALKNSQ